MAELNDKEGDGMRLDRSGVYHPVEVAQILGVHRRTVGVWITAGELRAVQIGPRTRRVLGEDVDAFLKARLRPGPEPKP